MTESLRQDRFPSRGESLTISTGSRLHFGLMEVCAGEPHRFGGVGLMVASPQTKMKLDLRSTDIAGVDFPSDPGWRPRLLSICEDWLSARGVRSVPFNAIDLEVRSLPHVGLGSGTQIQCLMASALYLCEHALLPSLSELTLLSKRGLRSHIGLAGFLQGGFIADYGNDSARMPRTISYSFPDTWRIVMVRDPRLSGDNGPEELRMFEQCSSVPNPARNDMLRLVDEQIVPSVSNADWNLWDRSIGVYGRYAGSVFAKAQGGVYRSPSIAEIVDVSTKLGVYGAAQSSWGPTVAMVVRDVEHAGWFAHRMQESLPMVEIEVAAPCNAPAEFRFSSDSAPSVNE